MALIYPSLISGDLLNLRHEIDQFDPICPGYHLDIMDFQFVPNLTWGPAFINAIAKATKKKLWVHLMVKNPADFLAALQLPPQSIVSFHLENNVDITKTIQAISVKKWLPGLSISPKTPIEKSFEFLKDIHQLTIMSVEPGFSGQSFIDASIAKIEHLAAYRAAENLKFRIAVDGGINSENINPTVHAGVDDIAAAAALFNANNPVHAYEQLVKIASK